MRLKSLLLGIISVLLVTGVAIACYQPPIDCLENCNVTITPTEEVTPTPTEEVKPTEPPSNPGGPGDGKSDGHTESLGCQHPNDNCNYTNLSGQPLLPPSNSLK